MKERKVLIFGGTTEGRELAEYLADHGVRIHVCVVTAYGESLLPQGGWVTVSHERLNAEEMADLMESFDPSYVVDATHPFAQEVSVHIREACEAAKKEYLRISRDTEKGSWGVRVESIAAAVDYLKQTEGNILVTTGSKELETYTVLPDYRERIYARVLSLASVAEKCEDLEISGRHLICMQGPFSVEMNFAMLKEYEIRYLVTKESGTAGGYPEKCLAAEQAGVKLVVIGNPEKVSGSSLEEMKEYLREKLEIPRVCRVSLVGIGLGNKRSMTAEAVEACRTADVLIGAGRMLEAAVSPGQRVFQAYRSEEIVEYLKQHPECERAAVVLSGDPGFYSGAAMILEVLSRELWIETRVIPGISSIAGLCAKLRCSWEDAAILSLHGREGNLIAAVARNRKTIILGSGAESVRKICAKLEEFGYGPLIVTAASRLSYPEEKIEQKPAELFRDYEEEGPVILCVDNPKGTDRKARFGIPDSGFLRGKVPMTKEEVRTVCLSKMRICPDSVIYDVGAGTGSISVESARLAARGKVYGIEKKEEALKLIHKNRIRWMVDNLIPVEGSAPEALKDLPAPDCVFLGGTGGQMEAILEAVIQKNPKVRVVLSAITMETVAEALKCLEKFPHQEEEIVQVSIGKAKEAGKYHMLMGQNPVYIISFTCGESKRKRKS